MAILCFFLVTIVGAAEFYVAPEGNVAGDGSPQKPWDLQTALSHPSTVRPGDTIWLRRGTYRGAFTSALTGSEHKPIIVRQALGERAVLDGAEGGRRTTLTVRGAWTWYWGFEITNTRPGRSIQNDRQDSPDRRGASVDALTSQNIKFINMVIHDTGQGFGLWQTSLNTEVYGCLLYYNGWDSDRIGGAGHGVYLQNKDGHKLVQDNIIFSQFNCGIHAYGGSDASLKKMSFIGNVLFNNGRLQRDPGGMGLLVGGTNQAQDIVIRENYFYNPLTYKRGVNLNPAYRNGTSRLTMEANYSAGLRASDCAGTIVELTARGNEFYGDMGGLREDFRKIADHSNVLQRELPTQNRIWIRSNRYEPGRAHLVVFNWEKLPVVEVDLSKCGLKNGEAFEIRDAQNYLGPPVVKGVFLAAQPTVALPTNLTAIAEPVDVATIPNKPVHTSSEFNVFVLVPATSAPTSAPSTAATQPR